MQFRRIKNTEDKILDELLEIYEYSFPNFEKRLLVNLKEALKDERYNFVYIVDKEKTIGILLYWEWKNFVYIEHLAIKKEFRGMSYGSKILEEFCNDEQDIILEIDPPIDEISKKREAFYEKIGFKINDFKHVHPPYRKEYEGHTLMIMTYGELISEKKYKEFNRFLKEEVMAYSEK